MFSDIFPPYETAMAMEPEELAPFVLRYLARVEGSPDRGQLNRYNFTLGTHPDLQAYAGNDHHRAQEFCKRLMEAWIWLEREMFLAPIPGQQGESVFITPRGERVLEAEDFGAHLKGSLLPSEGLDPVLARKVKPLFIRGDYEMAVLQALKEVEIRVRKNGGFQDTDIGVDLMRKAFNPTDGPLRDTSATRAEQEARSHLFAGSMGIFKNPSSHRDVEYDDPREAADIIHLANELLRIVERTS